jgi:hypothetical protein
MSLRLDSQVATARLIPGSRSMKPGGPYKPRNKANSCVVHNNYFISQCGVAILPTLTSYHNGNSNAEAVALRSPNSRTPSDSIPFRNAVINVGARRSLDHEVSHDAVPTWHSVRVEHQCFHSYSGVVAAVAPFAEAAKALVYTVMGQWHPEVAQEPRLV